MLGRPPIIAYRIDQTLQNMLVKTDLRSGDSDIVAAGFTRCS